MDGDESSSVDASFVQRTLCQTCAVSFKSIGNVLKYKEFYFPLLFFFINGLLVPNFDDLHYVFLTGTVGMSKSTYDFLNTLTYVGLLTFATLYKAFLEKAQIQILMLASLLLFALMTVLMYINARRLNTDYGVDDVTINCFIFFFGTNSVSILGALPIQVALTYLVPYNVEASTMALISGIIIWSYEVGAKISASVYCLIFNVDDDHYENYYKMLYAKLVVLGVMMLLVLILPSNEEI